MANRRSMKKLIPVVLSLSLLVGVVAYVAIESTSKASNNIHDYEYYYNDDSEKKDSSNMPVLSQNHNEDISLQTIDTTPDSITVFVNKEYALPADYIPNDLVVPDILFNINRYDEKKLLRQEAATAIEQLFESAEAEGLALYGISGYRSYKRQEEIYNTNIRTKGEEYTNRYSARPGHSEHQTGLVMDVSTASIGNRLEPVFAGTPEGIWLAENAHKFGFIIRYPKDKESITGYSYEPWHIRYVGTDLAQKIYDQNITLEDYYNYIPSENPMEYNTSYDSVIDVDESDEINEMNPDTNFNGAGKNENNSEQETDQTTDTDGDKVPSDDSDKNNENSSSNNSNKNNDKNNTNEKDPNKDNSEPGKGNNSGKEDDKNSDKNDNKNPNKDDNKNPDKGNSSNTDGDNSTPSTGNNDKEKPPVETPPPDESGETEVVDPSEEIDESSDGTEEPIVDEDNADEDGTSSEVLP